jgi:hypothetical protein
MKTKKTAKYMITAAAAIAIITIAYFIMHERTGERGSEQETYENGRENPLTEKEDEIPAASSDIIRNEYEEGKITEEKYILLSLIEAYDPENLDTEYAGTNPPRRDESYLLRHIRMGLDSFSPEVREAIMPFILSPEDTKSYWHTAANTNSILKKIELMPAAYAMDNTDKDGKRYRVINRYGTGYDAKARIVAEALDEAYGRFTNLGMPEPTDWIAVFLQDMNGAKKDGEEFMAFYSGRKRCIILINRENDGNLIKATAAHELFHCFQEYIPLREYRSEQWLWESTATWAEELVYPGYNTEHNYDPEIFITLEEEMFDTRSNREYGSYLWWFYLYQSDSKTGNAVKDALFDAKDAGMKEAIRKRLYFNHELKEYAKWNLNLEKFKHYADTGDLPSLVPSGKVTDISKKTKISDNVLAKQGGIQYFMYRFFRDIDKATFDISSINSRAKGANGVQIVYKLSGSDEWLYEDVSNEDTVTFCRTRPHENVQDIFFIVSNSDLDNELQGDINTDTTGKCPPEWTGITMYRWNYEKTRPLSDEVISKDQAAYGTHRSSAYMLSRDTLEYQEEYDQFAIKEQRVTYRESSSTKIDYGRTCSYIWELETKDMQGASTLQWDTDRDGPEWKAPPPLRLTPAEGKPGSYNINFDIAEKSEFITGKEYTGNLKNTCSIFNPKGDTIIDETSDIFTAQGADAGFEYENTADMDEERKKVIALNKEGSIKIGDDTVPVEIIARYSYG